MLRLSTTVFILLGLFIFKVIGAEQATIGFHSPWNPPAPHCEMAQLHVDLPIRNIGMASQLTNAGSCKYYSGDTDAAIKLWTEAYLLGRAETLKPLARVSSLLDSSTERALGISLLHAYGKQNTSYRYQVPLFQALQLIAYEPNTKANEALIIKYFLTAFELETEDSPFETFQFISYLKSINYFQHNHEEAENLFMKIVPWKKKIIYSDCYMAEALEYDIYKLPADLWLKQSLKENCASELL